MRAAPHASLVTSTDGEDKLLLETGRDETIVQERDCRLSAYHRIRQRFTKVDSFIKEKQREARSGFIKTLGGYKLQVNSPHKAVNVFVQGSQGWLMKQTMIKLQEEGLINDQFYPILQVHDELLYEFPEKDYEWSLEPVIECMQSVGDDYGFPTPVEASIIRESWDKTEEFIPYLRDYRYEIGCD